MAARTYTPAGSVDGLYARERKSAPPCVVAAVSRAQTRIFVGQANFTAPVVVSVYAIDQRQLSGCATSAVLRPTSFSESITSAAHSPSSLSTASFRSPPVFL